MLRNTDLPDNPNIKHIGIGTDHIRSMSTLHSDAIAAIMEFVDNAKDLQRSGLAQKISINQLSLPSRLIISNDGPGLDENGMHENLLGLGFSTKKQNLVNIGQFGQGMNAAIAFFGGECTVFSRVSKNDWIVALFSKKLMETYRPTHGKSQFVIYVKFTRDVHEDGTLSEYYLDNVIGNKDNFTLLLKFSDYTSETSLQHQFIELEQTDHNMCYSLHVCDDWASKSIKWTRDDMIIERNPRNDRADTQQPIFETSLRHRLSINYINTETLEPDDGLIIELRKNSIETVSLKESLYDINAYTYEPRSNELKDHKRGRTHKKKANIIIGKRKETDENDNIFSKRFVGVLQYRGGRLYEWGKFGRQKQQGNECAKTVVGVANFNLLNIDSNKESFIQDPLYRKFCSRLTELILKNDSFEQQKIKRTVKKENEQTALISAAVEKQKKLFEEEKSRILLEERKKKDLEIKKALEKASEDRKQKKLERKLLRQKLAEEKNNSPLAKSPLKDEQFEPPIEEPIEDPIQEQIDELDELEISSPSPMEFDEDHKEVNDQKEVDQTKNIVYVNYDEQIIAEAVDERLGNFTVKQPLQTSQKRERECQDERGEEEDQNESQLKKRAFINDGAMALMEMFTGETEAKVTETIRNVLFNDKQKYDTVDNIEVKITYRNGCENIFSVK